MAWLVSLVCTYLVCSNVYVVRVPYILCKVTGQSRQLCVAVYVLNLGRPRSSYEIPQRKRYDCRTARKRSLSTIYSRVKGWLVGWLLVGWNIRTRERRFEAEFYFPATQAINAVVGDSSNSNNNNNNNETLCSYRAGSTGGCGQIIPCQVDSNALA